MDSRCVGPTHFDPNFSDLLLDALILQPQHIMFKKKEPSYLSGGACYGIPSVIRPPAVFCPFPICHLIKISFTISIHNIKITGHVKKKKKKKGKGGNRMIETYPTTKNE